jgi:hypothetical protein
MLEALFLVVSLIKSLLKNQAELALENLALRQQLAITSRTLIDFFVVPPAPFRILFVLIVLTHDRRRIVHYVGIVWTTLSFSWNYICKGSFNGVFTIIKNFEHI